MPPRLTDNEMLQAYTDALRAVATAVAWQVDPVRFYADLADKAGHGPSAGLIDDLANTVAVRVLRKPGEQ